MPRTVGLEIQDNKVRLLVADTTGKSAKIVGFVEQPIALEKDGDPFAAAAAAIKQAFQRAKAPKGRVVISIDSSEAIVRELSVPFKEPDQVRSVIPHEFESVVHNYAIEDLVVDYIKTGETEKGTHLLGTAIPKKSIAGKLRALHLAGVDPLAIDLDVAALFNALQFHGAIDTDEPFLILHGTARFSKLIFVEGRRPRSIRTIRFAMPKGDTSQVAAPVEGEEKLEPIVAENAEPQEEDVVAFVESKTRELPGPVPIILVDSGDAARLSEMDFETRTALLEILAKEISRFLLANAATANPAYLLLSGDFEEDEAAAMLESATGIKTKTFAMLETVKHSFLPDEKEVGRRIAVPLGLALKGAGIDALGLDFRRGEFGQKRYAAALKTTVTVTLELLIFFLVLLAFHYRGNVSKVRKALDDVHVATAEVYYNVFNEEPTKPELSYREMRDRVDALQEKLGQNLGDYPMNRTANDFLGALFKTLVEFRNERAGEPGLWIQIDHIKVQMDKAGSDMIDISQIEVGGFVKDFQYPEQLKEAFRADETLSQIPWDPVTLKPDKDGHKFTISARRAR